ncbi:MAG: TsoY family (seleno)protein [Alkalilacustris sp.]
MQPTPSRPADRYSPLYLLASLGAGGLAVTFFMWLMFWVPHPGQPVPVFEDIAAAFATGGPAMQGMIALAMAGIAVLAVMNLRSLIWNLGALRAWSRTEAFPAFRASNAETQLMALPLALAMAVNVGFVLGLVFVPGLWGVVEYLFPVAMLVFAAIGVLALRLMGRFLGRVLVQGGFNCAANNSFGQILPAFAFAMVGVGMAAPAALSGVPATAGVALVLSTFFLMAAGLIAALALVLGVRAMMEHGAAAETAPTLMIVIPLLTVLGILTLRQGHGLEVHLAAPHSAAATLAWLTKLLSVQVLFGLFGLMILARMGYAARFLFGAENSPGAYALVCPGVGFAVMVHFWLNQGLVAAGLVEKFGPVFWAITAVALVAQAAMVWLLVHLNRRHFGRPRATGAAVPAE